MRIQTAQAGKASVPGASLTDLAQLSITGAAQKD